MFFSVIGVSSSFVWGGSETMPLLNPGIRDADHTKSISESDTIRNLSRLVCKTVFNSMLFVCGALMLQ